MSEPRKNRLSIDGGQVKDDEHVASYKPIPDSESEFRTSKPNLAKSKEKISADGAEEKLLQKEDEAKIITRVDMADAKYVVGDHRNGDAKIELDANKREFSGLTKEELMKYADDPFWVNLRWSLFVLFWAAWLCMLAGAIVIIVQAPKCAPPEPKKWYEKGPLVDVKSMSPEDVEPHLPLMQTFKVQGLFMEAPAYEVLDQPDIVEPFKKFFKQASDYGVKVILDLTANFVPESHAWFQMSVNRTNPYTDYFVWAPVTDHNETGDPKPPNDWVSIYNKPPWTYDDKRKEFYLHLHKELHPDLNFNNSKVVAHFDQVITTWITAGASGVRLQHARRLIVNPAGAEAPASGRGSEPGAGHTEHDFWRHAHSYDQPRLPQLLQHFAAQVTAIAPPDPVFTLKEEKDTVPEKFLLSSNTSMLKPVVAAPLNVSLPLQTVQKALQERLKVWPAIKLEAIDTNEELAEFAMLLPAAPILELGQLHETNETSASESLSHVVSMRDDFTIAHGEYTVVTAPARNDTEDRLLVCARWKAGHTGYVAVYNPSSTEVRGNLTAVPSLPDSLSVHHVSHQVKLETNFTNNLALEADDVLVPPKSTLILSYVLEKSAEQ